MHRRVVPQKKVFTFLRFYDFNPQRGMGLIDIIVSVAVVTIALLGISQIGVLGFRFLREAAKKEKAIYLAQEGLEVARLLRDESWSANVGPLGIGSVYYPVVFGGSWNLTSTDPGPVDGEFTRILTVDRVYRDVNDDIAVSGTEDPGTREVTVAVSWDGGTRDYELVTYLTDFLSN